ncbi:hypothetical protein TNCV_1332301 [Trichonephila clavipes]|nr:hypothetical protein TNCV_1332301 [Trichonephila clavipes]
MAIGIVQNPRRGKCGAPWAIDNIAGRWPIWHETSESKQSATIAGTVQAGALWSGECIPGIFCIHSSLWMQRCIKNARICP